MSTEKCKPSRAGSREQHRRASGQRAAERIGVCERSCVHPSTRPSVHPFPQLTSSARLIGGWHALPAVVKNPTSIPSSSAAMQLSVSVAQCLWRLLLVLLFVLLSCALLTTQQSRSWGHRCGATPTPLLCVASKPLPLSMLLARALDFSFTLASSLLCLAHLPPPLTRLSPSQFPQRSHFGSRTVG